jgi:hypothetical protein
VTYSDRHRLAVPVNDGGTALGASVRRAFPLLAAGNQLQAMANHPTEKFGFLHFEQELTESSL